VKEAYSRYNVSLGVGLSEVAGKVFRIGHLGNNDEVRQRQLCQIPFCGADKASSLCLALSAPKHALKALSCLHVLSLHVSHAAC
jgi:hypothetical protein